MTTVNKTADGVVLVEGLRVFTNNLDRGTVTGKSHAGDYGREADRWYEVRVDTTWKGEKVDRLESFNGERLATRHPSTGEKA